MRKCSRTACPSAAVATLTYVYSDSTAVVGPLATYAEPHTYDLCTAHAERLTPPRGWEIVRLTIDGDAPAPVPTTNMAVCLQDELSAIADAVREQPALPNSPQAQQVPRSAAAKAATTASVPAGWQSGASRGHLRALRPVDGSQG